MSHVVVIGGGVSGLVTAYRLRQRLGPSARLTVLEQSAQLGGKLRTVDLDGVPTDVGAEAFVVRNPSASRLVEELGLSVVHPTGATATIRAGGRTAGLPRRTFLGVPAGADAVRDVLSADGVARVAAESSLPPVSLADGEDASVGALLSQRLGREVVDHLVEPLLGGVYAGRADRLGLRATMPALVTALNSTGSLTGAASSLVPDVPGPRKPVFGTLPGGMRELVGALADAAKAEIRLGTTVRRLECPERRFQGTQRPESVFQGRWRVEVGPVPRPEFIDADAVVVAVPPPAARKLLADVAPAASAGYGRIEVGSMAVVSMVLPADVTLPEASGVLLAVGERHRDGTPFTAKAFTFTSRKWGGERVRLRASVGRVGEELTLRRDEDALLADVLADLAELAGVEARPDAWTVTKWGGGLPQYGVGHTDLTAGIERAVEAVPGLAVTGASFRGVGIPACVDAATAAAERVAAHLAV
ncbi:protoporphyrinogen oxidase [Actinophytocola glycyrrhizae]|uniref:Coproporphyrinogen III oxidase n=1 Tax=Actinophytocola glycyrrhizae TaxID=2044873 RepID=A0ABV9SBA2_9PSEU